VHEHALDACRHADHYPAHRNRPQGLPLGLQLVGAFGGDSDVLALAEYLEQVVINKENPPFGGFSL
jgi:Asp-tRNA(Asn)/Glu-tRNA(Gln) amidotransferase A subunit family amidase